MIKRVESFSDDIGNFYAFTYMIFPVSFPLAVFYIYCTNLKIDLFFITIVYLLTFIYMQNKLKISIYLFLFIYGCFVSITIFLYPSIITSTVTLLILMSILLFISLYRLEESIDYFKTLLLKQASQKYCFYIPDADECFWLPENPIKDTIYTLNNKVISIENTSDAFISIKKTRTNDMQKTFKPIYYITMCSKLLENSSNRQLYFHKLYGGLVFMNFMYFFTILVIVSLVHKDFLYLDFLFAIVVVTVFILFNLWFTIHLFVKNIEIRQCSKEWLFKQIKKISSKISADNIDEHYITLNSASKIKHKDKILELDYISSSLVKKLDSIYQIITPLLFIAQISIAIKILNGIFYGV